MTEKLLSDYHDNLKVLESIQKQAETRGNSTVERWELHWVPQLYISWVVCGWAQEEICRLISLKILSTELPESHKIQNLQVQIQIHSSYQESGESQL